MSAVISLEGLIDSRGGLLPLLIDELAADIVPLGDPADGLDMPKGSYGQMLSILPTQGGGTRTILPERFTT